jgi:hypothetical protein
MTAIANLQLWRGESRIMRWIREERVMTNNVVTGTQLNEVMSEVGIPCW